MKKTYSLILTLLFCLGSVFADVKLPRIFNDHMVLQRGVPINIWGWADPEEVVMVSLNGQQKQTKTDSNGKWSLQLGKEKAGGPFTLTIQGKNKISYNDVLIGDVWVCSGQSNMEWTLNKTENADVEISSANFPQIRQVKIQRAMATSPQDDLSTEVAWQDASPENVANFTAVGYYFAKALQQELNVPIGLINSSWGGTNIETWTSRTAFENSQEFAKMINEVPLIAPDSILKKGPNNAPSLLSNSMIEPLVPFNIKGVIWYQGENNAGLAHQYQKAFPLMINDWRSRWNSGNFPFYFVQLASFKAAGGNSITGSTWAELREAQAMALSLPNTGMAVTTDIGNTNDIHPRNKLDVGKRLAAVALNKTYKKKNSYTGPVFKKMKKSGNIIKLYFDHIDGGLTTKHENDILKGFEIAGTDKSFKKANATIGKNYILVSNVEISDPVAVRYGWSDDNIDINLFNKAGFPASPFRTDNWEGITRGKTKSYLQIQTNKKTMSKITLHGDPVNTVGVLPAIGTNAKDFTLVAVDLSEKKLSDFKGKNIILNIFPSINTGVCAASVRKFNEDAAKLDNTVVLCISKDLPFAQSQFCAAEGIENVVMLSDFRNNFGEEYGVQMADGPLKGLLSRAVVVINPEGKITYTEQVPEITQEPNFEAALKAL